MNINGYETALLYSINEVGLYRTCEAGRGRYFLVCFGQPTVHKNHVGTINEITKWNLLELASKPHTGGKTMNSDISGEISRLLNETSHAYADFHSTDQDDKRVCQLRFVFAQVKSILSELDDKVGSKILVNLAIELGKLRYMIDNTVDK